MSLPYPWHHTISLATLRRSGEEVRTPVWYVNAAEGFWVISFRDSRIARRIRNDPQVRFALCDRQGKRILGDWGGGTARLDEDPARVTRLCGELKLKYTWRYFLIVQVFYPLFAKRGAKVAIQAVPDS